MQFYRCKCGSAHSWTSMGVPECTRCTKCGSDLAQDSSLHEEPKPHEFVTQYDAHTGTPYERCKRCLRTRAELEEPATASPPP